MNSQDSPYLELVAAILSGLGKVRAESGAWIDSESEELERETQVFKIGECLRPFYLTARHLPNRAGLITLPEDILAKDTQTVYRIVKRDGFFPSPYSQIPGAKDQYIDFACFILEFSALAYDFWTDSHHRRPRLAKLSQEMAAASLLFLLKPDHRLSTDDGTRWGGTTKYSRIRKTQELFTDSFFTSTAILSLNATLEHPVLDLRVGKQDEIRNIIREAGTWIAHRFDNSYITGNERNTNRALLHSTWGLRALVETYHTQDPNIRKLVPAMVNAYLKVLESLLGTVDFSLQQEYLTILSEDVDAPLYYEDRSALGGILLTLVSLRNLPDLEALLEGLKYDLKLEQVLNAIQLLRNPSTGLWYRQGLILSIHSYLVEAFLSLSRRGKGLGRRLEISGHMIRTAVRQTFEDEAVVTGLQEAVYQRLLRLVDAAENERLLQQGLDSLVHVPVTSTLRTTEPSTTRPKWRRRS
jgi:hypothetical protein